MINNVGIGLTPGKWTQPEQHGGRTVPGVASRLLRRLLAVTAVIWHNHNIGQPVLRSLITYDH